MHRRPASAIAVHHPHELLPFLAALRSRSVEHRTQVLTELEPKLGEGRPTLDECRRALGLD